MDIKITAKNIKLTPAIKEFINTRVSKIENFFDNIVSAQVLISVEKKINQRADIVLHTGAKTTINASAVEDNLYKAIDAAAVKAEAQAKKIKNKAKTAAIKFLFFSSSATVPVHFSMINLPCLLARISSVRSEES